MVLIHSFINLWSLIVNCDVQSLIVLSGFRFGHDYPGGYERDMGGRPGYSDERLHGRFMGRSSGGYQGGASGNFSVFALPVFCRTL